MFQAANDALRTLRHGDAEAARALVLDAFGPNRVRQLLPSAGGWRIDLPTEPAISVGIELRHTSEAVRATLSDGGRSQDVTSHDYEVVGYATGRPGRCRHSSTVTHRVPRGSLQYDHATTDRGSPARAGHHRAPQPGVVARPHAPAIQPSELEGSLLDFATRRNAVVRAPQGDRPHDDGGRDPDSGRGSMSRRLLRRVLNQVEDDNPGLTFPTVPPSLPRTLLEWARGSSVRQHTARVTAQVGHPLLAPPGLAARTRQLTFELVFTHQGWHSTLSNATAADADDRTTGPFGSARASVPARLLVHIEFRAVRSARPGQAAEPSGPATRD